MTKARILADFISDGSSLADGTISVAEVSGAAPLASPTFTGTVVADGGIDIDNINIDGTTIALSSGDLTIDVAGNTVINSDAGGVYFIDGAVTYATMLSTGAIFNEGGVDADFRVESDTNANMLFVDGGASHVGVGTATLNRSGLGADHIVLTVGADSEMGMLELQGTRTSDADLGRVSFLNAGTRRAEIVAARIDADNSTKLYFQTSNAGTLGIRLTIGKDGAATFNPVAGGHAVFNEGGIDADFRVESDGNDNMLYVDGGANKVSVGSGSPQAVFNVIHSLSNSSDWWTNAQGSAYLQNLIGHTVIKFNNETGYDSKIVYNSSASTGFSLFDRTSVQTSFQVYSNAIVLNEDSADRDFRVESDTNANMLFVDGGANHVNIGTATDLGQILNVNGGIGLGTDPTITWDSNYFNLQTRGASVPVIQLKESGSGGYPPRLDIMNGAGAVQHRIDAGGATTFNETGADNDFRVESDTNANALVVDADVNAVMVGTGTVNGTTANYMPLIAGQFSTQRGTATNLFVNTWVTIHTFPTGAGNFIVSAAGGGTGNIADNTTGIVHVNDTVSSYADLVLGTNVDLRMSGLSLQVYQSIFNGANINWSVMRIC